MGEAGFIFIGRMYVRGIVMFEALGIRTFKGGIGAILWLQIFVVSVFRAHVLASTDFFSSEGVSIVSATAACLAGV